jgi:hypothetical protein
MQPVALPVAGCFTPTERTSRRGVVRRVRTILLAAAIIAAILAPWAAWEPPRPRATESAAGAELQLVVFNPHQVDQRQLEECRWCCDYNYRLHTALLVLPNALWIGSSAGDAHWIRRDGREWGQVGPALRSLGPDVEDREVEVALDEGALYIDLLAAVVAARDAGFVPLVVQPGVPVRWNSRVPAVDGHEG